MKEWRVDLQRLNTKFRGDKPYARTMSEIQTQSQHYSATSRFVVLAFLNLRPIAFFTSALEFNHVGDSQLRQQVKKSGRCTIRQNIPILGTT